MILDNISTDSSVGDASPHDFKVTRLYDSEDLDTPVGSIVFSSDEDVPLSSGQETDAMYANATRHLRTSRGRPTSRRTNRRQVKGRSTSQYMNRCQGKGQSTFRRMKRRKGKGRSMSRRTNRRQVKGRSTSQYMNRRQGKGRSTSQYMNRRQGKGRSTFRRMKRSKGKGRLPLQSMDRCQGKVRSTSQYTNRHQGRDRLTSQCMNRRQGKSRLTYDLRPRERPVDGPAYVPTLRERPIDNPKSEPTTSERPADGGKSEPRPKKRSVDPKNVPLLYRPPPPADLPEWSESEVMPLIIIENSSVVEQPRTTDGLLSVGSEIMLPQSPEVTSFEDQEALAAPLSPNRVRKGHSQDLPAEGSIFDVSPEVPGFNMRPAGGGVQPTEMTQPSLSNYVGFNNPSFGAPIAFAQCHNTSGMDTTTMVPIYNIPKDSNIGIDQSAVPTVFASGVSPDSIPWSTTEDIIWDMVREGPFDAGATPMETEDSPLINTSMPGCPYRMTSYTGTAMVDADTTYGLQLHQPPFLEFIGAPESARLLNHSPSFWVDRLGQESAMAAAMNLQRDAGFMMSNLQMK